MSVWLRMAIGCWALAVGGWMETTGVRAADYERDIKPLLHKKCFSCHGATQQKQKLRLDTVAFMKSGGESGPSIVPGKPDDSMLIKVLDGTAGFRMPPEGEAAPLSAQELEALKQWIRDGATAPANEQPQISPTDYWSYRVPQRPDVPAVKNAHWVRTPVDAFVAAKHEHYGLDARSEASRDVWLRRVTIDLIGLPPTRAELLAFRQDTSPQAYEKVVDDLLNRPQYGERWGRHWMDIWRYSDWYGSRGINEIRYSQRHIWRWRDWIVDSINSDKPYDLMLREMLAADELAPDDPSRLPATGFIGRNWYKFDRNVWMFDAVERPFEAFMALTLRCARCHDHKYDPITQEEYYRLRACFEPHNVRTDRLSALTETEKDATLGQVLKDGIPRVFDKDLDVVTYRFIRGDDRTPDKSKPLAPGVPAALGGSFKVEPVSLPVGGFYPELREGVRQSLIEKCRADVTKLTAALPELEAQQTATKARLAAFQEDAATNGESSKSSVFDDNFAQARPDVWEILNGQWVYENGHLVEKSGGSFNTFVSKPSHPQNFRLKLKYRTLAAGSIRSVGFSFDYQDKGNSQDVYTSANDSRPTVQAFHRVGGNQNYPAAGIKDAPVKVGEIVTLDVVAEGSKLTIDFNGERKLDYVLPIARKPGKLALWTHAGTAEFLELKLQEIKPSREQLVDAVRDAEFKVQQAQHVIEVAKLELASIIARVDAEVAKYSHPQPTTLPMLAMTASKAERTVAAEKQRLKVLEAEQHLAKFGAGAVDSPSRKEAEQKLAAAKAEHAKTVQAIEQADGKYAPVGEVFQSQSTGRRLALANWIASPNNPRTARVAINHVWNRHFGQPLVATTENFGLNGAQPTHPELLDWLATELVREQWRLKPVHRLLVLSATYRQSSTETDTERQRSIDPTNKYLWRANWKRLEAEVVRDGVLNLAGALDLTRGGPEIPEAKGQEVFRRSLYFRNTPNEKMTFLEVFDVADPNSCFRRKESVVPQQALALMNSGLAQDHSRAIAASLRTPNEPLSGETLQRFIIAAFEHLLSRTPTSDEVARCERFMQEHATLLTSPSKTAYSSGGNSKRPPATNPANRAAEDLVQVLLLHNDFVTIR